MREVGESGCPFDFVSAIEDSLKIKTEFLIPCACFFQSEVRFFCSPHMLHLTTLYSSFPEM